MKPGEILELLLVQIGIKMNREAILGIVLVVVLLAVFGPKLLDSENNTSAKAVKKIEDKSLDFIFFDAMLTEDQTYKEALAYYPKIKPGGYFMGDDAFCHDQVIIPLTKVLKYYKNSNPIIIYGRSFMVKINVI